jgi:hypothetical protein
VYNNTVVISYQNAIEYRFPSTTDVHLANNLANKPIRSRDGGSGVVESNLESAQPGWFVDPGEGDLHLVAGVKMDGLILTDEVPDDIDQTPRYMGEGFEIGADEVLSTLIHSPHGNDGFANYPNPAAGTFNIIGVNHDLHIRDVQVYNGVGEPIHCQAKCREKDCALTMPDQPGGIYFVKVIMDTSVYLKQVVIRRD